MSTPTREEAYKAAKAEVRTKKYGRPNKYTKWYFNNNTSCSWCGIFVKYILVKKLKWELINKCSNFAYVPSIWDWCVSMGYKTTKPQLMDLIIFDWSKSSLLNRDHVGFFIKDNGDGTITTLEGNTSSTSNGDGNCVQIRKRSKTYIEGYFKLPYKEKENTQKKYKTLYKLNFRQTPSLDGKIITTIPKDTEFTSKFSLDKDGWIRLSYEVDGKIKNGYVRVKSEKKIYCEEVKE